MESLKPKNSRTPESRKHALRILADVCKEAYHSGLTLEEVHFVSGAAWADYLDPSEKR